MSDAERILLQPNDTIYLTHSPESAPPEPWQILGLTGGEGRGQGSSSVCYDAVHNGISGRLKEFYPADMTINGREHIYHFTRTPDGQLCPLGGAMGARFADACREFLAAYHMLDEARRLHPEHQVLNNYIPPCQILYGMGADGVQGSVYIWTAHDRQGKNFQDYLSEVRSSPTRLPEHKLYNILGALISLAGCIRLLHQADLLHLDVKPSNFLVLYDPDFNINPHSISLFDVNTLHSIYSQLPQVSGTPGYQAPEVLSGEAGFASDIYSIGAMLYHSVVISPEAPALYSDVLYSQLEKLVNGSALIQASETNANLYLVDKLVSILRNTLARSPEQRYACCEDLISDLEQARAYLVPQVFGADLGTGQRLALLDSEPQADASPQAVIQELLYRHPLYTCLPLDRKEIHVLLLGAGNYGQLFLDSCLQAGQMVGKTLRITACSDHPELDQRLYLKKRPALSQFVNVDGSLSKSKLERYGNLRFCSIPGGRFHPEDPEGTAQALRRLTEDCPGGKGYCYAFVALGDNDLNRQVAQALCDVAGKDNCSVHYVLRSQGAPAGGDAHPVLINRSLTTQAIHPDLDRMGFNAHLCYASSPNLAIRAEREKYLSPYNRNSSMAYALSIPGKLASVGIYETDPVLAARAYQEQIIDRLGEPKADALFQRLVTLEHRRWVLEKVTQGYRGLTTKGGAPDYDALTRRGLDKDNAAKRLSCLVRSTTATPLDHFTPEQWDHPGPWDEGLDELDLVSLGLHRSFYGLAQELYRSQPMKQLDLDGFREELTGAPGPVVQEFERYCLCLKNILDGSRNYSTQLGSYESDLKKALDQLPADRATLLKNRVDQIHQIIYCVVASNKYRNYKQSDETLVRQIPYILTNQPAPYLVMAFADGRLDNGKNSAVFPSVASAAMLCPQKITYLYYFDSHSQASLLERKAASVLTFLARRGTRVQVAFHLGFDPEIPDAVVEDVTARFQHLVDEKQLRGLKIHRPTHRDEAGKLFLEGLRGLRVDLFDCSVPLFSAPRADSQFYHRVTARYPTFEFDWKARRFLSPRNCDYLRYYTSSAFVRIDEMFALMQAQDNSHYYPGFADVYQDLWRLYTGGYLWGDSAFRNGVTNWTKLCTQLELVTKENDRVCRLQFPAVTTQSPQMVPYHLPGSLHRPAARLMRQLIAEGAVTDQSVIHSCGEGSCLMTLYTPHSITQELDTLVDALYDFGGTCQFHLSGFDSFNGTRTVLISCDKLQLPQFTLENQYLARLLEELNQLKLIQNLQLDPASNPTCPRVSFRFSSPRMKELLTTAGEILEVYTYYNVRELGYFDDVACSFELRWASGDITNELDCVLTKGFRSILVECKSRRELSQDFYFKLWSIAEQFGLGTKKVLIANTYDTTTPGIVADNAHNRSRGRQMGIITISDPEEIENIGLTLRSIMEGTYQSH